MNGLRLACVVALAALLAGCASHGPRGSGAYKVGSPYQVKGVWYTPREQPSYNETGLASWYGPGFHGNHTANGERYDQRSLTAAHATLPMPVNVRVTNLENGRSLVVRVNDRGPFHPGRIIDVSERAAELLGFKTRGTARVRVEYLGRSNHTPYTMEAGTPKAAPSTRVATAPLPQSGERIAGMSPVPNPTPPMTPVENPSPSMSPIANPESTEVSPAPLMAPVPNPSTVELRPDPTEASVAPRPDLAPPAPAPTLRTGKMYVQVGAYTDSHSAFSLYNQILSLGKAEISPADVGGQHLYRVRLGPVANADEASRLTANLKAHGHDGAQIVME